MFHRPAASRPAPATTVAVLALTATLVAGENAVAGLQGGDTPGEHYGHRVLNIGDLDGDGRDDFLITAPLNSENGEHAGKVYVKDGYWGATIWEAHGENPGDRFGYSCAADGRGLIAVGAPWNDDRGRDAGKVYVFWNYDRVNGFQSSRQKRGRRDGDRFGWSLTTAQVSGDETPELIVGAPWNDEKGKNNGVVEIYSGTDGRRVWRRYGKTKGERFGFSVAGLVRHESDRFDHFVVSAPWNSDRKKRAGRVFVFRGGDFKLRHDAFGKRKGDKFGFCVASIGDADGDGRGDYASGAPLFDQGGMKSAGRVDAFSGRTGRRLWQRRGTQAQERYGKMIVGTLDLNEDERPDCLIGAPLYDDGELTNCGRIEAVSSRGEVLAGMTGPSIDDRAGSTMTTTPMFRNFDLELVLVGMPRNDEFGEDAGKIIFFTPTRDPRSAAPAPAEPTLAGLVDLLAAIGHVGHDPSDDEAEGHPYDFDDDGHVDVDDLLTFLDVE